MKKQPLKNLLFYNLKLMAKVVGPGIQCDYVREAHVGMLLLIHALVLVILLFFLFFKTEYDINQNTKQKALSV